MDHKARNLAVFSGERIDGVVFQPRVEPWYGYHQRLGDLPSEYLQMPVMEFYRSLGLSMRYQHYFTGLEAPLRVEHDPVIRFEQIPLDGGGLVNRIHTPRGVLESEMHAAGDDTWRVTRFPVHSADDLPALQAYFEHTRWHFNREAHEAADRVCSDLGAPQFFLPRSPYQALALDWMKFETFAVALSEEPELFEPVFEAIDASYDVMYSELVEAGVTPIINFGENIDAALTSPRFFRSYHIPFWKKRAGMLREAGIYTHVHIDGSFKPLLPQFADLPFDGIEALTFRPMGDATIEETAPWMKGKVLLDGIPAALFMPPFTRDDIARCVDQLVEAFAPRLIIGISDELPMGAPGSAVDTLVWLRDYCAAL